MIKILDKFVPSACFLLASLFFATALYLNADTTFEKSNTKPESVEVKNKTKILLVPGHDLEHPGAIFQDLKEADINLRTAKFLEELLKKDSAFEVYTTRENFGDYTETFQKYFNEKEEEILKYIEISKEETKKQFTENQVEPVNHVKHNKAPEEMQYILYAINKWTTDNNMDIVIHIHFNDYPRKKTETPKYNGFSIYVPDLYLKNGEQSQNLAKFIGEYLNQYFDYSNNPVEKLGIIPSATLIALGANNTTAASSVLIEYGYLYEEKFQSEEILKKAAEQTYLGIKKYIEEKK